MSAARGSPMRALRQLSVRSQQVRQLHITGAANISARALQSDKEAHPMSSPEEHPTRLTAPSPSHSRHFNTSRALKAPKDSSTIDFAFFPTEPPPDPYTFSSANVRVPILPDLYSPERVGAQAHLPLSFDTVSRQEVITAAADSTHISAPSVLSDVHDNTAAPLDFHEITDRLENAAHSVRERARNSQGTVKQLWDGFVDDLLGPKRGAGMA